MTHEHDDRTPPTSGRDRDTSVPRLPVQARRRASAPRDVRRTGGAAHDGPRGAAVDPGPPRPFARDPALVLPRVLRDLRRPGERPRGPRLRHAGPRPRSRRSPSSRSRTSRSWPTSSSTWRSSYARFPDEHPLAPLERVPRGGRTAELHRRTTVAGFERYEDCIECGLCLSACPVVVTAERYVGPAALAWAERVVEEPRGAEVANLLAWADDRDSVVALPRDLRVHRGVPGGREPRGTDHVAALRRCSGGLREHSAGTRRP